ncbi:MAG: hypothetical protein DMG56_01495 [Acidobacteria bacterium]|nr:MAG: hypothetical protein DMG56_01495 [Acidobacteriota bacterium]
MASTKSLRLIALCFFPVIGTLIAVSAAELVKTKSGYTDFLEKLGKREEVAFKEGTISPPSLISGSPTCRSKVFDRSHDKSSETGIWECHGPAKFNYYYGQDESIYIIAGAVEIEYLGKKFSLAAGDSTHFAADTTATWTIREHVRKVFRLYEPGRIVRYMRRLAS